MTHSLTYAIGNTTTTIHGTEDGLMGTAYVLGLSPVVTWIGSVSPVVNFVIL